MTENQKPTQNYYSGQRPEVARLVPETCSRILDVGCGFGQLGRSLREQGITQVYGVEINPDAGRHLEGVYTDFWIDNVETVNLPSDIGSFDCIIFADILEHLQDPWNTLKRYSELLKPGGYVIASIPNVRNIALLYNLIVRGRWRYENSGLLDKTHLRFFTRTEIYSLFSTADLDIELIMTNREKLSLLRRILLSPILALIPDLAICQFLIRAKCK